MKICPKCFAEYEDHEVLSGKPFCIECYGEDLDVNVLDLQEYLNNANMGKILARRCVIMGLDSLPIASRRVILRRIDNIVAQLRN
ncbi:MAG: hypothetical protein CVU89_01275 [Firmicutes bacterium HGW-Firmicutes-14]|nr:MAG: hypothetical protein CVU89_01275 [Firmicutes bacterium HGW-Firmicutes-14]